MSYLTFNKSELVNLEYSLSREILSTNRAGGYMSTTIVCCNTRKYHGLLVCPLQEIDNESYVLLSSLDETIIQHDQSFNFGIHRYQGGVYEPKGHKYIRDFEFEPTPTLTYGVGGVVLKKELLMVHNAAQLLIRYTLLEAHSPTTLRLRPFMAYRNRHSLSKANMFVDANYSEIDNGVAGSMYKDYPMLNLQLSTDNNFKANPDWYYNFEYIEEKNEDMTIWKICTLPATSRCPLKRRKHYFFGFVERREKQSFIQAIR